MSDAIVKIRNERPWTVEIAETGQDVEPGAVVGVVGALASRLCEQPANWSVVKTNIKKEG